MRRQRSSPTLLSLALAPLDAVSRARRPRRLQVLHLTPTRGCGENVPLLRLQGHLHLSALPPAVAQWPCLLGSPRLETPLQRARSPLRARCTGSTAPTQLPPRLLPLRGAFEVRLLGSASTMRSASVLLIRVHCRQRSITLRRRSPQHAVSMGGGRRKGMVRRRGKKRTGECDVKPSSHQKEGGGAGGPQPRTDAPLGRRRSGRGRSSTSGAHALGPPGAPLRFRNARERGCDVHAAAGPRWLGARRTRNLAAHC